MTTSVLQFFSPASLSELTNRFCFRFHYWLMWVHGPTGRRPTDPWLQLLHKNHNNLSDEDKKVRNVYEQKTFWTDWLPWSKFHVIPRDINLSSLGNKVSAVFGKSWWLSYIHDVFRNTRSLAIPTASWVLSISPFYADQSCCCFICWRSIFTMAPRNGYKSFTNFSRDRMQLHS